jgi:drug/metabolite transporter (DMT)-like permease
MRLPLYCYCLLMMTMTTLESSPSNSLSTHLYLLGASVLWGLSWPAGKLVSQSVPPLHAAMWRFLIASIILLMWLFIQNKGFPRLRLKQWIGVLLGGATGIFGYAYFFMSGLTTASAARGSLLIAFTPVLTTFLAAIVFREKITQKITIGMLLALLGSLVVVSHGKLSGLLNTPLGIGDTLLMGCVVTWSVYCLLGKKLMEGMSPLTNIAYSSCVGFVLLMMAAITVEPSVNPLSYPASILSSLVFLALGATVLAYVWYFKGIAVLGAGAAAAYGSLVPVFGVLFSIVLLNESVESAVWVGGLLTLGGVALMNYARNQR